MEVIHDRESDMYYARERVDNQTIELGMDCEYFNDTRNSSWWNIYITVFNKRKDMFSNMDKHTITGLNPFKTFAKAREMFKEVEKTLIEEELINGYENEITIFCTWVDNRRRDAYYRVLHPLGYDWGRTPRLKHKCIMKTYRKEDFKNERIKM